MTNEELIQEIKSNKNVQSNMYLLYSQNMPLIKQWSKKYISKFGEEDILQECYIALYQAVQSFELKGYKYIISSKVHYNAFKQAIKQFYRLKVRR